MSFIKTTLTDKKGLGSKKEKREITELAVCFALSFLFCGFSVGGGFSPFGATFALCLPYEYIFVSIPGCALGYAASLGTVDMLRYWGTVAVGGVLRVSVAKRLGDKKSQELSCVFSAVGVLVSGAVLFAVRGFSVEKALLLAGETVASLCTGVFFRRSFFLVTVKNKAGTVSVQDKILLVCSACLLLLCASGFTVVGIS